MSGRSSRSNKRNKSSKLRMCKLRITEMTRGGCPWWRTNPCTALLMELLGVLLNKLPVPMTSLQQQRVQALARQRPAQRGLDELPQKRRKHQHNF